MLIACEGCGEYFLNRPVYCQTCGKKTFCKSLAIKYEKKNYGDDVVQECRNCKFFKQENSITVAYYCIQNVEPSLFRQDYMEVGLSDSCNKFILKTD